MERDYENIDDLDHLSTDELRERIEMALRGHSGLDGTLITVHVENGLVRLIGRVGTSSEARVAEHIVTDQLGIVSVRSELIVDSLRRVESPEAIDDHLVDEERHSDLLLGDKAVPYSDEAAHLADNLEGEVYGTTDMQRAVEGGVPYLPPESATPEGQ
jgi:hypothetical protein